MNKDASPTAGCNKNREYCYTNQPKVMATYKLQTLTLTNYLLLQITNYLLFMTRQTAVPLKAILPRLPFKLYKDHKLLDPIFARIRLALSPTSAPHNAPQ